ncbi:MAG TPA: hypothetical protein VFM11_02410 [Burkholderiales bacterium]|nr:hypothetical protein [Burkholderiales bacterium]
MLKFENPDLLSGFMSWSRSGTGTQFRLAPVGAEPLALNLRLVRSANAIRVPAIGAMENQRVTPIKPKAKRKNSLPCGDTMMRQIYNVMISANFFCRRITTSRNAPFQSRAITATYRITR